MSVHDLNEPTPEEYIQWLEGELQAHQASQEYIERLLHAALAVALAAIVVAGMVVYYYRPTG